MMTPPLGRQDQSGNDEERPSTDDSTDSPSRPATRGGQYVSTVDEVRSETNRHVSAVFVDWMDRDLHTVPNDMREDSRNVSVETVEVFRRIGDSLVKSVELRNEIMRINVTRDNLIATLGDIVVKTFSDGEINWGRIVTLMFVAYRLAVKVLFEGDLLKMIIKGVVEYIGKNLVHWIVNCGGWDACRWYFKSTSAQWIGVLLAGCAVTSLVYWLNGN